MPSPDAAASPLFFCMHHQSPDVVVVPGTSRAGALGQHPVQGEPSVFEREAKKPVATKEKKEDPYEHSDSCQVHPSGPLLISTAENEH